MLFFWIKLKFYSINLNPLYISFLNLYNFRCDLLHGLDLTGVVMAAGLKSINQIVLNLN